MRHGILMIVMAGGVAACSSDNPSLLNIKQSIAEGPDEFAVLPSKPLTIPEDMASLPEPTPGGTNLTDPTPYADAAAALGGNPAVLSRGGGDGALLTYAGRYGVSPNIRAELAAADLEFRRENDGRLLERLFNVNVYFRAYEEQTLDQYAELERMRRAGIRTSSAPPDPSIEME